MDEGFDAGEAQGRESGMAEGWSMGYGPCDAMECCLLSAPRFRRSLQKGSELGSELGSFAGSVEAWQEAGILTTDRHNKLAADILAAVAAFPYDVRARSV